MRKFLPLLIFGVALAGCGSGDTAADPNAAKAGEPAPAQASQAQQGTQTSPGEANQRAAAAAKGNG